MSIPTIQQFMRPLLELIAQLQGEVAISAIYDHLARHFGFTETDWNERIAGGIPKIEVRIQHAIKQLNIAKFLHRPNLGYIEITQRGKDAIADKDVEIDNSFLRRHSVEYDTWRRLQSSGGKRAREMGIKGEKGTIPPEEIQMPKRQIEIEQATFERLKLYAKPLEDTTDTVINRALDALHQNLYSKPKNRKT